MWFSLAELKKIDSNKAHLSYEKFFRNNIDEHIVRILLFLTCRVNKSMFVNSTKQQFPQYSVLTEGMVDPKLDLNKAYQYCKSVFEISFKYCNSKIFKENDVNHVMRDIKNYCKHPNIPIMNEI